MLPTVRRDTRQVQPDRQRRAGQQRHHRDQRNRRQILRQQDRERLPPVGGAGLLALGQDLQPERGRGQRQAATDHRRRLPGQAEQHVADAADHQRTGQHLQQTGTEHRAPHHPQPPRRQLQPDHEQHQHHAELGNGGDTARIDDQPQHLRADHHPGQQITEHRTQPEPLGQRYRDHRRQQEHQRGLQKGVVVHAHAPVVTGRLSHRAAARRAHRARAHRAVSVARRCAWSNPAPCGTGSASASRCRRR